MSFEPGFRLQVGPRFQMSCDWQERLQWHWSRRDDDAGAPMPLPRRPTDEEIAALVLPGSEIGAHSVCIFRLPEHLLSRWWSLVEHAALAAATGGLEGFDAFCAEVVEFLEFKLAPVPNSATCLLATAVAEPLRRSDWWAVLNLGVEPLSVLLSNRPADPPSDVEVETPRAPDGIGLKIGPGEGCWLPEVVSAEVLPSEEPVPILLICGPQSVEP